MAARGETAKKNNIYNNIIVKKITTAAAGGRPRVLFHSRWPDVLRRPEAGALAGVAVGVGGSRRTKTTGRTRYDVFFHPMKKNNNNILNRLRTITRQPSAATRRRSRRRRLARLVIHRHRSHRRRSPYFIRVSVEREHTLVVGGSLSPRGGVDTMTSAAATAASALSSK